MALKLDKLPQKNPVARNTGSFLTKDISFFGNKMSEKQKAQLYSSLATLLVSGLDLYRALEIVFEENDKKSTRQIFGNLLLEIQKGKSLSQAMESDANKVFSAYEISSVKIGEEVGKLYLVLDELNKFFESSLKRKRMLINALTYPMLVVAIALIAVFFMMIFVVPMFQDVFKRFNGELPAITKAVINLSNVFTEHIGTLLLVILAIVVLTIYLFRIEKIRLILSLLALKIPFIGGYIVKNQLAKITGMLSMMLASGVHLIRALELTSDAISFLPYKNSIKTINASLEQGKDMYSTLTDRVLYPSKFRSLVKIGEEVNKLDYFFDKMNKEYNTELEQSTSILGTILEPILLVFLGGLIGVILVAMYLPLFDLSSQW